LVHLHQRHWYVLIATVLAFCCLYVEEQFLPSVYGLICFQTFSLAGLGAGVTEAILVNPFEVVKVSLQANRSHLKEVPSTWTITKQIVSTQVRV
jgi:hypothetical protein